MTMLRRIVESYPFTTQGVSEDMFYSLSLILNDINAVHVDTARLRSLAAPTLTSGGNQRVRWEVGRLAAARSHSFELFRHGSPTSVEMAILLITPPFAVAAFLLILAAVLSVLASQTLVMVICIAMIIALGVDLAIGLIQTKAPWQTWAALGAAPLYIPWKAALQIVAIARLKSADKAYEPTARE